MNCRVLIVIVSLFAFVIVAKADEPNGGATGFELRDGDRVVFLGGGLIERSQKYGYLETALTARHPDRNVTFRNLGWEGDTVWAESRGIFDTPDVGYQRMIEHVQRLQPTVIFAAYGNNEAFVGEDRLIPFIKQYEKLLDELRSAAARDARFVMLSPIPHENHGPPLPDPKNHNDQLRQYHQAIEQLATERKIPFVDLSLLTGRSNKRLTDADELRLTSDGMRLNEYGYYRLAQIVEGQIFGEQYSTLQIVASAQETVQSDHAAVRNVKFGGQRLKFEIRPHRLRSTPPLPTLTESEKTRLVMTGLTGERYQLRVDGKPVAAAANRKARGNDADDNEPGGRISFRFELPQDQMAAEKLRRAVIEKNRLYFHRWRPQNVTYLFGFRKHEQGQNAKEVAEFEKLVLAKEQEIARLKQPRWRTYEIVPVD